MHGFARTRQCQCRNQPERKALAVEKIRQRPMIVTGRFKTDHDGVLETSQVTGQLLKFVKLVCQSQAAASARRRRFDQNIVIVLGDIDSYQCQALRRIVCFRSWTGILL